MPHDLTECIRNCRTCHEICLETLAHCLAKGGVLAAPEPVGLLEDCIQICQVSADFMARHSERHAETCRACSVICERCAEACTELAEDDETVRRCVEVCRACAESCHEMAAAHGLF